MFLFIGRGLDRDYIAVYRIPCKYPLLCIVYFCAGCNSWMVLEGDSYMSMTVVMLMALFMVFCVFTFVRGE